MPDQQNKVLQDNKPEIFRLNERCLIKLSGDDAESFLQNLVTQDVAELKEGQLIYACLLTPQGRFLHDFFIFKEHSGFFLECETERREDLIRRLKIFKLRAKVVIEDCSTTFAVYAHTLDRAPAQAGAQTQYKLGPRLRGDTDKVFQDPRLTELGFRYYLPVNDIVEANSAAAYKDWRIHLGVPEGSIDIKPEVDTLADANLDYLNAVSWTKGCFVGQEVAARMENRGLVKKRMVIVSGDQLAAGAPLTQNGHPVGEIRCVNAAQTEGLAILKLAVLQDSSPVTQPDGTIISMRLPEWLKL